MKIKSITIVISSLRGGGAERVSIILANNLCEEGYSIDFIVLNLTNAIYHKKLDKRINLINFNVKHARTSIISFFKYLKKNKPDRLLVFNHELAVILVFCRVFFDSKFLIIARNISTLSQKQANESSVWHKFGKTILIKYFYKKVDLLIAQSKNMKTDLIEYLRIESEKIHVINNPISSSFSKIKNIKNLENRKNEILFVGRLEKEKGLFYLLDAFKQVNNNKKYLNLRIVGKGTLLSELKVYVKKLELNDNVIFNGFDANPISHYQNSQLTVLSSFYEGFPNVLTESIASGTPVVAFDCPSGPSEIIQNDINGYLANYLDANDLAEKINKALDKRWDLSLLVDTVRKYDSQNICQQYKHAIGI